MLGASQVGVALTEDRHPSGVVARGKMTLVRMVSVTQLNAWAGTTPSTSWTNPKDTLSNSGGAALVPMVQSTDFGYRDYTPLVAALNRPRFRSVFAERKMGAGPMVMIDEHPEPAAQVPLAKHDYVVEALPPNRSDHPLDVCPLPWRARSRQDLPNPEWL